MREGKSDSGGVELYSQADGHQGRQTFTTDDTPERMEQGAID